MTFLLDVNVLIALIDPSHVGHDAAHQRFEHEGRRDWATCPITQNDVIRIVGSFSLSEHAGVPGRGGDDRAPALRAGRALLLAR